MSSASTSDEDRRKQEMSWFAAMALGGGNEGDGDGSTQVAAPSGTVDFTSVNAKKEQKDASSSADTTSADKDKQKKSKDKDSFGVPSNIFSQAVLANADADFSGTFAMSSNKGDVKNQSSAERANLEAAAAAFENDMSNSGGAANNKSSIPSGAHPLFGIHDDLNAAAAAAAATQQSILEPPPQYNDFIELPMFSERISLPRPVFFGAVLPPRVLQQARQMVHEAIQNFEEVHPERKTPPKLTEMPRSVRNIVGALRSYGYGLDLWIEATAPNSVKAATVQNQQIDETYWRGVARVSTYQPVWPQQRRQRIEESMRNLQMSPSSRNGMYGYSSRPRHVQRASTAPARILEESEEFLIAAGINDRSHPLTGSLSPPIPASHKTPLSSLFTQETNEQKESDNTDYTPAAVTSVKRRQFGIASANRNQDTSTTADEPNKLTSHDDGIDNQSDKKVMANNQFSQWLQSSGNDERDELNRNKSNVSEADSSATNIAHENSTTPGAFNTGPLSSSPTVSPVATAKTTVKMTDTNLFSQWAQGGSNDDASSSPVAAKLSQNEADSPAPVSKLTDKNLFSQWALQEDSAFSSSQRANSPVGDSTTEDNSTDKSKQPSSVGNDSQLMPPPPPPPPSTFTDSNGKTPKMSDQNLFSQWARGEDTSPEKNTATDDATSPEKSETTNSEQATFSRWALGNESSSSLAPSKNTTSDTPATEKALFSQWARGGDTFVSDQSSMESVFTRSTFQRVAPTTRDPNDSDDDSVIDDELKKQVGVNDHLSKAIASLAEGDDEEHVPHSGGDPDFEQFLLSQVPADPSRQWPLTNFEVTRGCVPLFGIDDPPLPAEGDLGIHETKEDQVKSYERKRSQEIIEKLVAPNIFGPIACPNPASSPDDFHSWNSRNLANIHSSRIASTGNQTAISGYNSIGTTDTNNNRQSNLSLPSLQTEFGKPPHPQNIRSASMMSKASTKTTVSIPQQQQRQSTPKLRFGWWSTNVDESHTKDQALSLQLQDETDIPLHMPPLHHSSLLSQVVTMLEPTPQQLRQENLPLSRMHAGTWAEQTMPYLCDRPPSYRYLQIDTQAVGFPPLGGEVEPLFCSLSIYNVETLSTGTHDASAPTPDLRRCGRVTEALYFDVVCDEDISTRCASAMYPYAKFSPQSKLLQSESYEDEHMQGTRCGVFPLPSNLNVSNLYAVLVVRKVLTEDADIDPYLKASKTPPDINRLKTKAEKASKRHGSLLVPFAFGVAPLLQVFGVDNPVMASSRAVQIPLFKFSPGLGERQIIDHIMVMLFPRADHRANGIGGPAAVTNGGNAMLVMRNYGYLGLHAVVDSKSSLARDRLVDFTGELQLRRSHKEEECTSDDVSKDLFEVRIPDWRPHFTAEPTDNGGRVRTNYSKKGNHSEECTSSLYAQELAPVPVKLTPSTRATPISQGVGRSKIVGHDIEPFYNTVFCNEMLFHPRLLHNCPRGIVVVKVELREMAWDSKSLSYLAHAPSCGPSLHNNRRGPFLVQSAFTSCIPRGSDPYFIDEFKLKLPLNVEYSKDGTNRTLALLFTVYKVKIGSKNKWKRAKNFFSGSSVQSDNFSENDDSIITKEAPHKTSMQQVACGFLPLTKSSSIIDNGSHDVKIEYISKPYRQNETSGTAYAETLRLVEKTENVDTSASYYESTRDDSQAEEVSVESGFSDRNPSEINARTDSSIANVSDLASQAEDSLSRKSKAAPEPISLSVRIVLHSSLHSQNDTLSEFLQYEHDAPRLCVIPGNTFLSTIRLGHQFIMDSLQLHNQSVVSDHESKFVQSVVDITKHHMCFPVHSIPYLFRIMPILWKSFVMGSGDPDFGWANPATSSALRVHSFVTILHLLGAANLYMTKNGLQKLDGINKWNVVTLSRVLSLLFDEEKLFGNQAYEVFDCDSFSPDVQSSSKVTTKSKSKRRHVRQTFEFVNEDSRRSSSRSKPFDMSMTKAGTISFGSSSALSSSNKSDFTFDSVSDKSGVRFSSTGQDFNGDIGSENTSGMSSFLDSLEIPPQRNMKVDSKNDFQSALRAAASSESESDFDRPSSKPVKTGNASANAFLQAFGDSSRNRRWMTAPLPLSTIRESEDNDGDELALLEDVTEVNEDEDDKAESMNSATTLTTMEGSDSPQDVLDTELIRTPGKSKSSVKQMRVPRVNRTSSEDSTDTAVSSISPSITSLPPSSVFDSLGSTEDTSLGTAPSEKDIESAGTAFLDAIGKSLGLSSNASVMIGEEQRVGSSHHRKTRSRSSIDWTLLAEDRANVTAKPAEALIPPVATDNNVNSENEDEKKRISLEAENSSTVKLPGFVERLNILGKSMDNSSRWFPYTYEVVIMQWSALLREQQRSSNDKNAVASTPTGSKTSSHGATSSHVNESLSLAAERAAGIAITVAPLLFEVIKQSLGFRIHSLYQFMRKERRRLCPPLVQLDETLLQCLEQIIVMVSDACIDSRNFDTWDLRQTSSEVNDSIIRFLRDLFAFLAPSTVHRLILAYFARFVTKDGKQWQDRDSAIGLRCSWETAKLRLNAVSALARFPDFVRVNCPLMLSWKNWWQLPTSHPTDDFYDKMLSSLTRLRRAEFVGGEGALVKLIESFPAMESHWLSEIIIDICILGTEHAEQYIQHRSASLLHELFWTSNQDGIMNGISQPVATMYVTFTSKLLQHISYISNFAPKSQLRKDLLPCAVYVFQSAPAGLLRALWRKLLLGLVGKGCFEKYGYEENKRSNSFLEKPKNTSQNRRDYSDSKDQTHILDAFSLLNLCIKTMEYEGDEKYIESEVSDDGHDDRELWRREYLVSTRDPPSFKSEQNKSRSKGRRNKSSQSQQTEYCTASSRKWQAHDSALTIVNTGHRIVWELYKILNTSPGGDKFLNPATRNKRQKVSPDSPGSSFVRDLDIHDIVVFIRAATSLYLHALALQLSDVTIVRTFKLSAELIKIFGIKLFIEAVGETLQHWMRVLSLLSGARRAAVRVEATDLTELILRSTWEYYGSFFRIRVPLLAVQTEVMERIVATAAARFYRNLRLDGSSFEVFSTMSAEASLVPLWRTLDRISTQPASQNVAFRGALVRMAEKLKKLYRAYVAARVLSFIQGARATGTSEGDDQPTIRSHEIEAQLVAKRISILRVINASEGYSKQFLGFQGTSQQKSQVAHFEAVEDALIDAADVFSSTELPEHRVAWLRMLAEFHASRKKYAEEATCHFNIHITLHQAARLHGSFWSNTPFLPWTDNIPDPVYIDGDNNPTADMDYNSVYDVSDFDIQNLNNASSFRRIFYRVANSVGMFNDDWEGGASKNLFCGVTFPSEYHTLRPWITYREMEEALVDEAEAAGDLFLKAGIIESSRLSWNFALSYYAEKFNFAKLATSYGNLSRTVVSKMPSVDSSLPQEVSTTLGRFYRVWFHGGAPDDLSGIEFVYRTEGDVKLDQFGNDLRDVIKSIIPDRTPINLMLDGRAEERTDESTSGLGGFSRIGPAPLEPVRIKVTPLRPINDRENVRGRPEWFHRYVDEAFSTNYHRSKSDITMSRHQPGLNHSQSEENREYTHRDHMRSFSASIFSSVGSSTGNAPTGQRNPLSTFGDGERSQRYTEPGQYELSGIEKFCFLQPKDRKRSLKDWWKNPSGDITEKTLKITQLQVSQPFPACVARQAVAHRLVYSQSPLEAGIDAVCQWCAVLFRTAVATVGQSVLQINDEPGIGTEATKIVADAIHYSNIKDIGLTLLKKISNEGENEDSLDFNDYDRLTEDEAAKYQLKLARVLIVFVELLHLLISRNRDLLSNVIKERKLEAVSNMSVGNSTHGGKSSVYNRAGSSVGNSVTADQTQSDRHGRRVHSMGHSTQEFSPAQHTAATRRRQASSGSAPPQHQRIHTDGVRTADSTRRGSVATQQQQQQQSNHHTRGYSVDEQSVFSQNSLGTGTQTGGGKRDSAIAIHIVLQRAFTMMVKELQPKIQNIMPQGETPRWLKQCATENYFTVGTYKQNRMPIADELCFKPGDAAMSSGATQDYLHLANPSIDSPRSMGGSSVHSIVSRGSDKYGLGQL